MILIYKIFIAATTCSNKMKNKTKNITVGTVTKS